MDPAAMPSVVDANAITVTETRCETPLVVTVLFAQRRLAPEDTEAIAMHELLRVVSSACSTSCWGVGALMSVAAFRGGVEHVDVAEERSRTAVGDRRHLSRLCLAAVERATQHPGLRAADGIQRAPEVGGGRLVGHV